MNLKFCELFLKYLASSFSAIYVRQLESSMDKTEWLLHNEGIIIVLDLGVIYLFILIPDVHSTDILSIDLYSDNLFTLADKIIEIPSIILNPTFPTHHLLLPSLMTIYSNRLILSISFKITIFIILNTLFHFYISELKSIKHAQAPYLRISFYRHIITFMRCSKYSVAFVTALLPFCTDSVECLALIKEMVKIVPEYYVVSSVVNFLIMATRHPGNERILAFSLLGELVKE
uniref:DUF2013 domain-containing protein n=1 Tax=Heterorhabditis bacteriophora TaxID=37862 RepID=A0A1I7XL55_HETBA